MQNSKKIITHITVHTIDNESKKQTHEDHHLSDPHSRKQLYEVILEAQTIYDPTDSANSWGTALRELINRILRGDW